MSFIPIVIKPYQDELIYSWVHRLAKANGLCMSAFAEAYMGMSGARMGELPYDIRYGYATLFNSLFYEYEIRRFYLEHSTFLHTADPSGRFCGRKWPRSGASGRVP